MNGLTQINENTGIKALEAKIEKSALKLISLKDNKEKDITSWNKEYFKIFTLCIKWIKQRYHYSNDTFPDELFIDPLADSLKSSIEKFKVGTENSFIKYFTIVFSNSVKFYKLNEKLIKTPNKAVLKISKLEKLYNLDFASPEFKDIAISNGDLTEKEYQKLYIVKLASTKTTSLDTPVEYDESNTTTKMDLLEDTDNSKLDSFEKESITNTLLESIKFIYIKNTRKDAVYRDSCIYTFFLLELLFSLSDKELELKCHKYKFINKEAVIHFKQNTEFPTQKDFAEYTDTKPERYKQVITKLKDALKDIDTLKMYYEKN